MNDTVSRGEDVDQVLSLVTSHPATLGSMTGMSDGFGRRAYEMAAGRRLMIWLTWSDK